MLECDIRQIIEESIVAHSHSKEDFRMALDKDKEAVNITS